MTYNIKTEKEKMLSIWITIISHGGLGHAVVFGLLILGSFI